MPTSLCVCTQATSMPETSSWNPKEENLIEGARMATVAEFINMSCAADAVISL